jgi:hypothetical protein
VFGRVKISFLLGFTFAAYNLDRVRSFRAKQAELVGQPKRRAKRHHPRTQPRPRDHPARSTVFESD